MRRRYIFYGYVQGVGFRWRARQAAELNGAAGFVRNLPDGTVEMELEGEPEAIEKTVGAIGRGLYISISNAEYQNIPEKGEKGFYIAD